MATLPIITQNPMVVTTQRLTRLTNAIVYSIDIDWLLYDAEAEPFYSTPPPPPTNVQVFCRLNDSSPWVLCSTP